MYIRPEPIWDPIRPAVDVGLRPRQSRFLDFQLADGLGREDVMFRRPRGSRVAVLPVTRPIPQRLSESSDER